MSKALSQRVREGNLNYLTRRAGSGTLSEISKPLILSPRNDGICFPSTVSVMLDLGLHIHVRIRQGGPRVNLLGKLASHPSDTNNRDIST